MLSNLVQDIEIPLTIVFLAGAFFIFWRFWARPGGWQDQWDRQAQEADRQAVEEALPSSQNNK
jgi:hypothetical protein